MRTSVRELWKVDDKKLSPEERKVWASALEREMHVDLYDAAIRGVREGLARAGLTVSERARYQARLEVLMRIRQEMVDEQGA
jgi:hypothetical protein